MAGKGSQKADEVSKRLHDTNTEAKSGMQREGTQAEDIISRGIIAFHSD